MKTSFFKNSYLLLYTVISISIWITASVVDTVTYSHGIMEGERLSFFDILILKIPNMLLFHRAMFLLIGWFLTTVFLLIKTLRELKISEQKLKEANNTKDKLFTIISHDFKGPFTGFMSLSEILLDKNEKLTQEDIWDIGKSINLSARKLYDFMDNILFWTKSQMEHNTLNPVNAKLSSIVNDVLELYSQYANSKNIKLINDIDKNIDCITDINTLKTILRNLINNAIKYTPKDGYVKIISSTNTSNFIEISVIDNGIGMDKQTIDRLFADLKKVSKPGTDGEQGAGIGLSLTKEMIERFGGKIWVESQIGSGTNFTFNMQIVKV